MKQDYHCAKNESRKGKKSIGFCDSLQISEQKNASRFDRSGRGCKGKDTGDDVPPAADEIEKFEAQLSDISSPENTDEEEVHHGEQD